MLADFAGYLLRERLTALAADYLRLARELGTPLLRHLADGTDEACLRVAEENMAETLIGMAEGRALEAFKERLRRWEVGAHRWLPREGVETSDLILVFAAQRRALLHHMPSFCASQSETIELIWALERYYTEVQHAASEVFDRLRRQDTALIEALENAHERDEVLLDTIVLNVPLLITAFDRNMTMRWASPATAMLLGITMKELLGRPLFEMLPEAEEPFAPLYERAFQGETLVDRSVRFAYLLDGEERVTYWDYSLIPMRVYSEEIDNVLCIANEVSDRVAMELRQQEEVEGLLRADMLKDEFLNVLSHELRTPLNCIQGFTRLLRRGQVDEADRDECLGEIEGNASRMLRLVETLLDFATIRAGTVRLEITAEDFASVVREAVGGLQALLREKGQSVELAVDVVQEVELDRLRILEVLTNLIGNAIKLTPAGGSLGISARVEGEWLVTEVHDAGPGFTREDQQLLFRPFVQIEGEERRGTGGTGLGLSIAKALVEAHDGTIDATSPGPGLGACFRFSIPLHPPKALPGEVPDVREC